MVGLAISALALFDSAGQFLTVLAIESRLSNVLRTELPASVHVCNRCRAVKGQRGLAAGAVEDLFDEGTHRK